MKKIFFLLLTLPLLAAACATSTSTTTDNATTKTSVQSTPPPASQKAQIVAGTEAWHVYQHNQTDLEFRYPSQYKATALPTPSDYEKSQGRVYIANLTSANAAIKVFSQGSFDLNSIPSKFAPTGLDAFLPEAVTAGSNKFYRYGAGGVSYPDQYFYNFNGKLLVFVFDGPYDNEKSPNQATKDIELKLLATVAATAK